MFYIIKNVSDNNIIIGKKTLKPDKEMEISDLGLVKNIIQLDFIEVREKVDNSSLIYKEYKDSITQKTKTNEDIPINNKDLKQDLLESVFNFYFNKDVSKQNLDTLIFFYKNIGFTSKIKKDTLDLLDNIQNKEELIEILLNNIYPELLEIFLINKKED